MASKWHKPFAVILELAESTADPIELEAAERRLKELAQQAAVNRLMRLQRQREESNEYTNNGD